LSVQTNLSPVGVISVAPKSALEVSMAILGVPLKLRSNVAVITTVLQGTIFCAGE